MCCRSATLGDRRVQLRQVVGAWLCNASPPCHIEPIQLRMIKVCQTAVVFPCAAYRRHRVATHLPGPGGWKAKLSACWLLSVLTAQNQTVYRPFLKSFTACCFSALVIVTRWEFLLNDLQYKSASFHSNFIVFKAKNALLPEGSITLVKLDGIPKQALHSYTLNFHKSTQSTRIQTIIEAYLGYVFIAFNFTAWSDCCIYRFYFIYKKTDVVVHVCSVSELSVDQQLSISVIWSEMYLVECRRRSKAMSNESDMYCI